MSANSDDSLGQLVAVRILIFLYNPVVSRIIVHKLKSQIVPLAAKTVFITIGLSREAFAAAAAASPYIIRPSIHPSIPLVTLWYCPLRAFLDKADGYTKSPEMCEEGL